MSSSQIQTRCLSHLGITVSTLEDSVRFYTDVLGFDRCFEDVQEEWSRVGVALDGIVVELFSPHPSRTAGSAVDPFYATNFGRPKLALTVMDVDAAYARVTEAGLSPLCPITTTSRSRFFMISDPDGTPIQLHQFKDGQALLAEVLGHPSSAQKS